ncbi:MAG: ABC-2 transporter permease [Caldilineaceae bacterium]|nr:ABC-2 transporter permease [Caldilineaceae bacterium]
MRKVLIIARKELLSTLRQRNLLLIMFLSPIILVSIMGLAFGGLGSGSDTPDFADIGVAVVNLDAGFDLQQRLPASATNRSLMDLEVEIGGQTFNLGEQLQQNPNLAVAADALNPGNVSLNFGNQLAAILLSQPLTATALVSSSGGFDLGGLSCPLLPETESETESGTGSEDGSLDDLFDAVAVGDAETARAGVMRGDYAVAVIIPSNFSNQLVPDFGLNASEVNSATGAVEVFANNATPISASIVRAVVEGIVSQFERVKVAIDALALTAVDTVSAIDPNEMEASVLNINLISGTLQTLDASVLEPLACLIMPGAGNVQIEQQPLDEVQARSPFSILMTTLGAAQAVFFALFTGVFGINAIYEDRRQGTLQRVLVSPTSSTAVLAGRLLGNLIIVMTQLLVLLLAFTTIATLVEGELTLIWGSNVLALLLVVLGLSLFTTGMGVLIVGLAQTSEQVQLIGPMVTILIGGMGGIFGALVPREFAQFSPTWWGLEAMRKLGAGEFDIGPHLLVLFSVGLVLAGAGTFFFRRRMDL